MADKVRLTIDQGATFRHKFIWNDSTGTPVDLTGYTARMQARPNVADTGTPLLELTTENGGISIGGDAVDPTNGEIDLYIAAGDTAAISWTNAVYDLELDNIGEVTRLVSGSIVVTPEVTK